LRKAESPCKLDAYDKLSNVHFQGFYTSERMRRASSEKPLEVPPKRAQVRYISYSPYPSLKGVARWRIFCSRINRYEGIELASMLNSIPYPTYSYLTLAPTGRVSSINGTTLKMMVLSSESS
jgi:hypothetical protein